MQDEWLWKPVDTIWDLVTVLWTISVEMVKPCLLMDDMPELRQKLKDANFSLVIADPSAHACTNVIINFLDVPSIIYGPLRSMYMADRNVGSPCPFSYVPSFFGAHLGDNILEV